MARLMSSLLRAGASRRHGTDEVRQPPIGGDWVRPYWMERQLDPESPAFVPPAQLPDLANVTHRNWTVIGNLDSPWESTVDPRGLVTSWSGGWSLDWWIGADDRWHIPAREVGVRQRLVEASPVVETAMRIPGGDAVQRVYAVRRSSAEGAGELAIVEVENSSKVPVAMAFGVRPYNPEGLSVVERIDLHGETIVTVNGQVALLLPKPPARFSASTFDGGDSAVEVMGGEATDGWAGPLQCAAGSAQAAFVYPLAHGASVRVALPLELDRRGSRGRGEARRRAESPPSFPAVVPGAGDVARGWGAQTRRGLRLELPDQRLSEAVEANRGFLLLLHDRDESTDDFRDAAYQLGALDCFGFHDEVARVLASYPERQRGDGFFGQGQQWDANGVALWAVAQHWHLARDHDLVEALMGPIANAVQWIERSRHPKRGILGRGGAGGRDDDQPRGLLPAGTSTGHLGLFGPVYWDDFWGVAGLGAGAELLAAVEQPTAAEDATRFAASMWADVERSLALGAERLGTQAIPAGPGRPIDAGMVGGLVAAWPLDLMGRHDERMAATLDTIRQHFTLAEGRALSQGLHEGIGVHLTLQLAGAELLAGDPRCLDRLAWLLEVATPTWTWPEVIDPRLGSGSRGDGHHGRVAAELLRFVRQLLVREVPEAPEAPEGGDAIAGELALATLVPEAWLGQGWEVHDAPTAYGLFSYAVRWHGDRPALLWELQPHDRLWRRASVHGDRWAPPEPFPAEATPAIRLTAPGLDPSWSTTDLKGEALLSPR